MIDVSQYFTPRLKCGLLLGSKLFLKYFSYFSFSCKTDFMRGSSCHAQPLLKVKRKIDHKPTDFFNMKPDFYPSVRNMRGIFIVYLTYNHQHGWNCLTTKRNLKRHKECNSRGVEGRRTMGENIVFNLNKKYISNRKGKPFGRKLSEERK